MATYTEQDLADIRLAKKSLAEGRRVGEAMHRNRRIRYSEVSLTELDALERSIMRELQPKKVRYSLFRTNKGY